MTQGFTLGVKVQHTVDCVYNKFPPSLTKIIIIIYGFVGVI